MKLPQRAAAAVLAGALGLALSLSAFAQARPAAGEIPTSILRKLDLTVEQDGKVGAAASAYESELVRVRGLSSAQEKREGARAARAKYQAAVKEALTPDQQKKLDSLLQEAIELRAMGPVGARLVGLDLTVDQKKRIRAITDKYQDQMDKLRASRTDATDRAAVSSQLRAANLKMLDEIKAVLTPEQQKAFAPTPTKGGK